MVFQSDREKTKTVRFDTDKSDERELWEWMRRLPFGEFSKKTKGFWLEQMKEESSKKFSEGEQK